MRSARETERLGERDEPHVDEFGLGGDDTPSALGRRETSRPTIVVVLDDLC
jgi:hypothetical protein